VSDHLPRLTSGGVQLMSAWDRLCRAIEGALADLQTQVTAIAAAQAAADAANAAAAAADAAAASAQTAADSANDAVADVAAEIVTVDATLADHETRIAALEP
jgi:uncharacterized protein involved in exopolysaccharide biosynthesis